MYNCSNKTQTTIGVLSTHSRSNHQQRMLQMGTSDFTTPHDLIQSGKPLPILISETWGFHLSRTEINGKVFYAVQDWVRGLTQTHDIRSSISKLKKTGNFDWVELPYLTDNKKMQKRPFADAEGLYAIVTQMRCLKSRPLVKAMKEYLARALVLTSVIRANPDVAEDENFLFWQWVGTELLRNIPNSVKKQSRLPRGESILNRDRLALINLNGHCVKCGEKGSLSHHHHHVDPSTKIASVTSLLRYDWNTVIQPELDKTVQLCSKCHRRTHIEMSEGVTPGFPYLDQPLRKAA